MKKLTFSVPAISDEATVLVVLPVVTEARGSRTLWSRAAPTVTFTTGLVVARDDILEPHNSHRNKYHMPVRKGSRVHLRRTLKSLSSQLSQGAATVESVSSNSRSIQPCRTRRPRRCPLPLSATAATTSAAPLGVFSGRHLGLPVATVRSSKNKYHARHNPLAKAMNTTS